jgi:hypothetical protein
LQQGAYVLRGNGDGVQWQRRGTRKQTRILILFFSRFVSTLQESQTAKYYVTALTAGRSAVQLSATILSSLKTISSLSPVYGPPVQPSPQPLTSDQASRKRFRRLQIPARESLLTSVLTAVLRFTGPASPSRALLSSRLAFLMIPASQTTMCQRESCSLATESSGTLK